MAVMIGITILLCMSLKIRDHAKLAGLTLGIIMIFSTISPDQSPFVNASLRFRYKKVSSLYGSSKWIHTNFGNTKAAVDFEIVPKDSGIILEGRLNLA